MENALGPRAGRSEIAARQWRRSLICDMMRLVRSGLPLSLLALSWEGLMLQKGDRVEAKWSDGKYYAGLVTASLQGRKYRIQFNDGETAIVGEKSIRLERLNKERLA